jgi:hypothetical protein
MTQLPATIAELLAAEVPKMGIFWHFWLFWVPEALAAPISLGPKQL